MATYFSPLSLLVRDFCRSEQRFTEPIEGIPSALAEFGPANEWRLLNSINLSWFSAVLSKAMQGPIQDGAHFARAIEFAEYLAFLLADGLPDGRFTENEPY